MTEFGENSEGADIGDFAGLSLETGGLEASFGIDFLSFVCFNDIDNKSHAARLVKNGLWYRHGAQKTMQP